MEAGEIPAPQRMLLAPQLSMHTSALIAVASAPRLSWLLSLCVSSLAVVAELGLLPSWCLPWVCVNVVSLRGARPMGSSPHALLPAMWRRQSGCPEPSQWLLFPMLWPDCGWPLLMRCLSRTRPEELLQSGAGILGASPAHDPESDIRAVDSCGLWEGSGLLPPAVVPVAQYDEALPHWAFRDWAPC